MKNSNLAERLAEFADVLDHIDSPDSRIPRILPAAANTEMQQPPRAIPARRRIRVHDQQLRSFRVF